jgi:YidC/Oxa1 family membrane protein insertase
MNKRFFLTFFTILAFFFMYSYFANKFFPQAKTPSTQSTQQQQNSQETPLVSTEHKESNVIEDTNDQDLAKESIGEYVVTFSTRGGYIRKLTLKKFGDELLYTNIGYVESHKNKVFTPKIDKNTLQFVSSDGIIKEFKFDKYVIDITFKTATDGKVVLFYNSMYSNSLSQGYQEEFQIRNNDVKRQPFQKIKQASYSNVNSVGARDRFFCIALLKDKYDVSVERIGSKIVTSTTTPLSHISFYVGPQIYSELRNYDLDTIINYGFFHDIGILIVNILHFFFSLVHNWGVSIVLFALLTYGVLFPFTMMSTKALRKIQEIQPIVEELKKKYKDDTTKLNKEVMDLYKKYKINPLGGCLPVVLQLPVFIALYQVFMRLIELKGAHFLWIKDLSMPDHAFALPFPPPVDFVNILPILITALSFLQQKTTTSSQASEQKMMMMILPLFMGFIFYSFPSCLNLYWFIQNILTFAYQYSYSRVSKKTNSNLKPAH